MTNVLIVDDERMIQELFSRYIDTVSDRYCLIGTIKNAANAELYCLQSKVGLILMDVCTADNESGIAATAEIKKKFPDVKVIIITSAPDYRFIEKARQAGADSFWYKEFSTEELSEVMDKTMAGESIYPDTTPRVQMGLARSDEFTPREIEVLYHVVQGESVGEIAEQMGIGYNTAKWHIKNLKEKTGAKSIAELAVMVARAKLILPEY